MLPARKERDVTAPKEHSYRCTKCGHTDHRIEMRTTGRQHQCDRTIWAFAPMVEVFPYDDARIGHPIDLTRSTK